MNPNLVDQLAVFVTIAEEGTFAKAAKKLNKTIPSVSYTISTLEKNLDILLFDRSGYRPVLTEAGRVVLEDSDQIFRSISKMKSKLQQLNDGIPGNLSLVIDPSFPIDCLSRALGLFYKKYPWTNLDIMEKEWVEVERMVDEGLTDIGIIKIDPRFGYKKMDGLQLGRMNTALVTSPGHPLFGMQRKIMFSELDEYVQIILSADVNLKDTGIAGTQLSHTTRLLVANGELAKACLYSGVGWAYMARNMVEDDLETGNLVELQLESVEETTSYRIAAIWRMDKALPANAEYLVELLKNEFK